MTHQTFQTGPGGNPLPGLPILATALSLWFGCVATHPVDPGATVQLQKDEGLLVVHIRTTGYIERIRMSGAIAGEGFDAGEHLRVIVAAAKDYRWSHLETRARDPEFPRPVKYRLRGHSDLGFRVVPGRINYPGMLDIERSRDGASVRIVNRTATALVQLRALYPLLLERFPFGRSRFHDDIFLERYRAVVSTAGSGMETDLEPER